MSDTETLKRVSLSHRLGEVTENALGASYDQRHQAIIDAGDQPGATVDELLALLEEVSTSDFAMSMLYHKGISSYWTHYMVLYPRMKEHPRYASMNTIDRWLLESCPAVLAAQERFEHFLNAVQDYHADLPGDVLTLASIPCGLMDDLLWLRGLTKEIRMVGLDIDKTALQLAEQQAMFHKKRHSCSFFQGDIWKLSWSETLSMILCNGLTIYEEDSSRMVELFSVFQRALKPGGVLVVSYMTPPPSMSIDSPWISGVHSEEALRKQSLLFDHVITPEFRAYRLPSEMKALLEKGGFEICEERPDRAYQFPTLIAKKKP